MNTKNSTSKQKKQPVNQQDAQLIKDGKKGSVFPMSRLIRAEAKKLNPSKEKTS